MKKQYYVLFAIFIAISFVANATTYYVRATGYDTNTGTSSETALLTVSKALDKATSDGDIIDISGTVSFYNATPVAKVISKNIIMQGDNKSTAIIQGLLSGAENISPIRIGTASGDVVVAAPTVTIRNLTFKDFDSAAETGAGVTGGVINFILGDFTCMNVNFENNTAYFGGAISVRNYIKDNAASSVVLIQDCYFYNNRALKTTTAQYSNGGAVSVYAGASTASNTFDVTIDRCTFESNSSENAGSALRCRIDAAPNAYNKILVRNSTFVDNTNKNGGVHSVKTPDQAAVYVEQTVAGARYGEVKFINNTIAYNKTEKTSGIAGFLSDFCPILTVINNIFYSNYNSAATPVNYSYRSRATLVESRNNITNGHFEGLNVATAYSGNMLTVTDVQLKLAENLADNGDATKTLNLDTGSVAINGGYATGAPTVDQRGASRVGIPDVGAYEKVSDMLVPWLTEAQQTTDNGTSQDPTSIMTYNGSIYWVYVNVARQMTVAKKTGSNLQKYILFNLESGIDERWHICPTIGIDKNGYIHVTGDMHNSAWKYFVSQNPEDISAFSRRYDLPGSGVTYTAFFYNNNGEMFLSFRHESNTLGKGNHRGGILRYNAESDTFVMLGGTAYNDISGNPVKVPPAGSKPTTMVWGDGFGGNNCWYTKPGHRVYFDSNNRMHLISALINTCLEVPLGDKSNTHLIYAYSDDMGVTWHKASGEQITSLPLTASNATVVLDRTTQHDIYGGKCELGAFDSDHPIVTYFLSSDNLSHSLMYNGSSWVSIYPPHSTNLMMCRPNGYAAWYNGTHIDYTHDGQNWKTITGVISFPKGAYQDQSGWDREYFKQTGNIRYHGKFNDYTLSKIYTLYSGIGEVGGQYSITSSNQEVASSDTMSKEIKFIVNVYNKGIIVYTDCIVQIYTIEGKMIKDEKMHNGQMMSLPSGVYIIHAVTANRKYIQKIIL